MLNLSRRTAAPVEPASSEPVEDGHELQMSLFDHLNELRVRVFRAFAAIVVGTLIGIFFAGDLLDTLRAPYCAAVQNLPSTVNATCQLQILDPTGSVIVYFRIALLIGGVLAIPIVTYQLLMFIVPGLTNQERRYILIALPLITLLFLVGVAFAWFMLTPAAMDFLVNFQPDRFKTDWAADLYLSFVTALLFWMGVAFETPLIFFLLAILGVVDRAGMVKNWRFAVVAAAIAAALITPTIDPVNMSLVMGPLLVLYVLSILLVSIGQRINRPSV